MDRECFLDAHKLLHHRLVDLQAACGIQDQNVIPVFLRGCQGGFRDVHRILGRSHGKDGDADLLSVYLQLLHCSRAVYVAGCQQRPVSLLPELAGKLRRGGRLSCALKTCHHDDRDAVLRIRGDGRGLGTHQPDQLFVDDLHDLLSRGQGFQHLRADRALLDPCDELLHDLVADIGLEKRHPDFLQSCLDVCLGKLSFSAEIAENLL